MDFIDKLDKLMKSREEAKPGVSAFESEPKFNVGDMVYINLKKDQIEKEIKELEDCGEYNKINQLEKKLKINGMVGKVHATRFQWDDDEKPKWRYLIEIGYADVGSSMNSLWFDEEELQEN